MYMLKSKCRCDNTMMLLFALVFCVNYVVAAIPYGSDLVLSPVAHADGDNTNSSGESNLKGKLIFAHVLYRHGDRTPIGPYPNDPWNKREFWPAGWGQLTNIGKAQHYQLGQWLRQRYDSLLNRTYSEEEIYIRSTNVDRTLMSALANLAGLYPPVGDQIWNKDILWQPIPVHTIPEKLDFILAGKDSCPTYDKAYAALMDSAEFQSLHDRYSYLFNYLTKYSGSKVQTFTDVQYLNNTLFIQSLYNKSLPEWTKKVYPSADMTYISDFAFAINTYTRQMARLKIGPLIKEILDRFDQKLQGKLNPDRSVWVYSAHDATVANILNALKMFEIHSPPYASCILMELRLIDNKYPYVSIFYRNSSDNDPSPMYIPNCGYACPLKKMFSLYKEIMPDNWEQECKLSTFMMTYEEASIGRAMAILAAIITVMMILSYAVMIYIRRRKYKTYFSHFQVA